MYECTKELINTQITKHVQGSEYLVVFLEKALLQNRKQNRNILELVLPVRLEVISRTEQLLALPCPLQDGSFLKALTST